ncbi:uncharacterized protein LOC101764522 isoform X2 [Setaria italica]|uniref:uncharacterized protein LOC101764522 isoform X2 n=1 Tax=Setaria italica TaxID=4555 RepID=UPI000BE5260F|nr:uncharacterized protein LOC101764522 isoform X2 [Setaria italica]
MRCDDQLLQTPRRLRLGLLPKPCPRLLTVVVSVSTHTRKHTQTTRRRTRTEPTQKGGKKQRLFDSDNRVSYRDSRIQYARQFQQEHARAIISMANEEMIMAAAADHHRQQHRHLQDSGSSSSAHVRPAEVAPAAGPSSSRQGFAAVAAAPVIDQQVVSGLSMKRSLQLFLQKRKARAGGAVAPPYAGGRHAQAIMRH